MSQPDFVDKREAFEIVTNMLEKPGITIDVDVLIKLFEYQTKIAVWMLRENRIQQSA